MVYLTFLEMFILLAISSHLSKLLVVFTELIETPKTKSSKYTVVGITSGKFSPTSYVFISLSTTGSVNR